MQPSLDITHHSLPLISEDSLPVFHSKVYQQVLHWSIYFSAKFTTCCKLGNDITAQSLPLHKKDLLLAFFNGLALLPKAWPIK